MSKTVGLTKDELLETFDLYYEGLRNFLYYKTGDIDLSEDLAHDVFIKLWEKKHAITSSTVKGLIFTIGNNLMVDHYRKKRVESNLKQSKGLEQQTEHGSPQFVLEGKEFQEQLNRVLNALPDGCREVFLMNKVDQLKYAEIANHLGLSVKAIEKRMSKAIRIVKEQLGIKI